MIHRVYVRDILDVAPLKEGCGNELQPLHDAVNQHLRALKAMGYEPSGPFVTSVIESKLDQTTMFEWQRHLQEPNQALHLPEI